MKQRPEGAREPPCRAAPAFHPLAARAQSHDDITRGRNNRKRGPAAKMEGSAPPGARGSDEENEESQNMKRVKGWFLGIVVGLFSLTAGGEARAQTVQWDLVSITNFNPVTVAPGGVDSALAADGSQITVTGSGTFVVEKPAMVTGGGVWLTRSPLGGLTGFGTYQVMEVLTFNEAAGMAAPNAIDKIGKIADHRSGAAVLRIAYSDGSKGVLVVNCHLPVGSPAPIPEGISATKDFIDYFFIVPPIANVDGNRTLFHEIAPAAPAAPPAPTP